MTDYRSDEMLSAYLDGEVTAEERAQIERQLADSAELRQLLEELRGLRGGFESLPQYQLDEEFAGRVLRRAEQAMLSEAAVGGDDHRMVAAAPLAVPAPPETQPSIAGATVDRWKKGGVRVWGWAAAAIAAGLVIMFFDRPPALQDKPAAAPAPAGGDAHWLAKDTPTATPATTPPVGDVATHEPAAKMGPAETGLAGKADIAATTPPLDAAKRDVGAIPLGAGLTSSSSAPSSLSTSAVPPLNAIAVDERLSHSKKDGGPAFNAALAPDPATESTLVVNCTVTREAQRDRKFDLLLNNRQIVIDEERPDVSAIAKSEPAPPARAMKEMDGKEDKGSAVGRDLDVVVVDATANELSAVMSELNNKSEWFPSVEVAPESPVQAPWTAYNRGQTMPVALGDKQKAGEADQAVDLLKNRALSSASSGASKPSPENIATQAPAAQVQIPAEAGNRGINLQQQSRARRLAVSGETYRQEIQRGDRGQANFAAQNAAPADTLNNLPRSVAGNVGNEGGQQLERGNLQLNAGNLGADDGPRVRALFLLRVVDSPAAAASPAAPAMPAEPMTK